LSEHSSGLLPFAIAGDWHGFPLRVLAPQRLAQCIADAKARGVYKGRKASIDTAKVKAMKADGMGPSAIAKALKIGRASVYRALEG
jgi:DNA invertase Pin-like site-specific DNA recombinase